MKNTLLRSTARRQLGMSMIEILVGMAIGLISMLIIFQVFSASTEHTRTTSSASDALISGAQAEYQLERDIRSAGMGFGQVPHSGTQGGVGGCPVAAHNIALAAPDFTFPLTPVQIIPNALTPGAPVQIAVMYGNSAYFVLGRNFTVGSSATSKKLAARDGFHVGDIVLVTSADIGTLPCAAALVEVTGFPTPDDGHSIVHAQGASYVSFYTGGNPRATMNATSGAATTVAPSGLTYNLGPNPSRNLWQVVGPDPLHPQSNPNFLVFNDTLHSDAQAQAAAGIVNLQAEYGVDNGGSSPGATAGDGIISPSEWTSVQPTDPTRLLAVRFAVLARSQQYEATAVTTVAPFWANDPVGHSFTMFNVDGTADTSPGNANDWRRYRYRVYESIVPLRNMLWWQQ